MKILAITINEIKMINPYVKILRISSNTLTESLFIRGLYRLLATDFAKPESFLK